MRTEHYGNLSQVSGGDWQTAGAKDEHRIGAMIHITITRPPTTLAAAHHGVSRGDPIYAI